MSKRRLVRGSTTGGATHRHGQENRRAWWIAASFVLVLLLVGAVLLLRSEPALPTEITSMQAFEEYREGALFLDVRSEAEWNKAHIQGSVLIPLDQLANRLSELPRNRDIVVVCASGARSEKGAAILRQAGFERVTGLSGGLQSWIAAGYPLEQ